MIDGVLEVGIGDRDRIRSAFNEKGTVGNGLVGNSGAGPIQGEDGRIARIVFVVEPVGMASGSKADRSRFGCSVVVVVVIYHHDVVDAQKGTGVRIDCKGPYA